MKPLFTTPEAMAGSPAATSEYKDAPFEMAIQFLKAPVGLLEGLRKILKKPGLKFFKAGTVRLP